MQFNKNKSTIRETDRQDDGSCHSLPPPNISPTTSVVAENAELAQKLSGVHDQIIKKKGFGLVSQKNKKGCKICFLQQN